MSEEGRPQDRWAHLRFAIVGPLLVSPLQRGELHAELEKLAARPWRHPMTGQPTRFGVSTLQRWYYAARSAGDPVGVLRRKVRRDSGQQACVQEEVRRMLEAQYQAHKNWSYQLHYDNLRVLVEEDPKPVGLPSYSTLCRYMKGHGLIRKRLPRGKNTAGWLQAQQRLESREVRSFEAEYVQALWHLDFHQGSRPVLTAAGEWVTAHLLAVLDDHSRLACHLQWYLGETAEDLVHGLCQAFLKRGLPRALMTDNGAAMLAAETRQGLQRLGIVQETTLPYSPYQNGKQESFFGQVEGRLLAMLEGCRELTLALLNQVTQAWVELEYQRHRHSELGCTPLERFLESAGVGRECPPPEELRVAFGTEVSRSQRRSDGTISVAGVRFEIPSRFRHVSRVTIRYAGWDLAHVYLIDSRRATVLCPIYPLDKAKNADSRRRRLEGISGDPLTEPVPPTQEGLAPLLRKLVEEYAATGLPPAYLPKISQEES